MVEDLAPPRMPPASPHRISTRRPAKAARARTGAACGSPTVCVQGSVALSRCTTLIHFIPDSLTYSVPLFLKRRCDRTLGLWRRPAHPRHVLAPRGKGGAGRGQARRGAAALAAGLAGHQRRRPARGLPADAGLQASQRAQGRRAAPAGRVYYPIVTSQNSSTTLYQVSHRIQQLFS